MCSCCFSSLIETYVVSAPKSKYRCIECALHYNVILEVPEEIIRAMKEIEEGILV